MERLQILISRSSLYSMSDGRAGRTIFLFRSNAEVFRPYPLRASSGRSMCPSITGDLSKLSAQAKHASKSDNRRTI